MWQNFYLNLAEDGRMITPWEYLELALKSMPSTGKDIAAKNEVVLKKPKHQCSKNVILYLIISILLIKQSMFLNLRFKGKAIIWVPHLNSPCKLMSNPYKCFILINSWRLISALFLVIHKRRETYPILITVITCFFVWNSMDDLIVMNTITIAANNGPFRGK